MKGGCPVLMLGQGSPGCSSGRLSQAPGPLPRSAVISGRYYLALFVPSYLHLGEDYDSVVGG